MAHLLNHGFERSSSPQSSSLHVVDTRGGSVAEGSTETCGLLSPTPAIRLYTAALRAISSSLSSSSTCLAFIRAIALDMEESQTQDKVQQNRFKTALEVIIENCGLAPTTKMEDTDENGGKCKTYGPSLMTSTFFSGLTELSY